ncbi:MAG: Rpn family recombination-promoting nuclease/putative transposase [Methylobacter sp.]
MKFADPTTDFAFKKIFGSDAHPNVLIEFLNSILDLPSAIAQVSLVNPYQVPKIAELKDTVLDVRATDQNGQHFIVEMQVQKDAAFAKRSLYYTAKSYVQQLGKGQHYSVLEKVYFVGILDFSIFDNGKYITRHLILETETQQNLLADFEFTFIELPKFKKPLEALSSDEDKWLYFLQNAEKLDEIPEPFLTPVFKEAFEIATQSIWNLNELEVYEYQQMQRMIRESVDATSRNEARKEGRQEGIQEGRQEGRQEAQKAIARNLLDILDDVTIAQKTGLTPEEVSQLRLSV